MTEIKQIPWPENTVRPITYEDVLAEYRWYVRDPKAELPADIIEELRKLGKKVPDNANQG